MFPAESMGSSFVCSKKKKQRSQRQRSQKYDRECLSLCFQCSSNKHDSLCQWERFTSEYPKKELETVGAANNLRGLAVNIRFTKKETDTWFQALGAQLPLSGGTMYDSAESVSHTRKKVKQKRHSPQVAEFKAVPLAPLQIWRMPRNTEAGKRSQNAASSGSPAVGTVHTVADLFDVVKRMDVILYPQSICFCIIEITASISMISACISVKLINKTLYT